MFGNPGTCHELGKRGICRWLFSINQHMKQIWKEFQVEKKENDSGLKSRTTTGIKNERASRGYLHNVVPWEIASRWSFYGRSSF